MTTSAPERRKRKLPQTDHHRTIDFWVRLYQRRFGMPYPFAGGKDATTIRRLLRQYEAKTVRRLMIAYIYDDNEFLRNAGHTVTLLWSSVPRLLERANRKEAVPQKGDPVSNFEAWAAKDHEWCRRFSDGMYPAFGGAAWARSLWPKMKAMISKGNTAVFRAYGQDEWRKFFTVFLRREAAIIAERENRAVGKWSKDQENAEAPVLLGSLLSGIAQRKADHGKT